MIGVSVATSFPLAAGLIATFAGGGGGVVLVAAEPPVDPPEHPATSSPVTANMIAGHLVIAPRPSDNTATVRSSRSAGRIAQAFLCTRTLSGPGGLLHPPGPGGFTAR
ncbi:hypothetical protein GCM10018954_099890 [Kutzneria kofuensis]